MSGSRRWVLVGALTVLALTAHTASVTLYRTACDSRRAQEASCVGMTEKNGRRDLALGPVDLVALADSADHPGLRDTRTAWATAGLSAAGWLLSLWPLTLGIRLMEHVWRARRQRIPDEPSSL